MRAYIPIVVALLSLSGPGCAPEPPGAVVEDAVVTLPAVRGRPGAAYFTIRSDRPVRLVGVTSPSAGRIELHETVERGGTSEMARLGDAAVAPGAPLEFEPGGKHAMLHDLAPGVRAGDRVLLNFHFDRQPAVTAEAEVRPPGDAGHDH